MKRTIALAALVFMFVGCGEVVVEDEESDLLNGILDGSEDVEEEVVEEVEEEEEVPVSEGPTELPDLDE